MGSRVLEQAVAKIDRERERAIERLAAKVRRDILVPACTKHGLDFKSGNGTWVLSAGDSMFFDAEEAARKGFRLKRLFDALETRIGDWPRGSEQLIGKDARNPFLLEQQAESVRTIKAQVDDLREFVRRDGGARRQVTRG